MQRRVALRIAYDGSAFVGSQWQPNGRTVQGAMETAWAAFTGERLRVTFAGRTDASVHATGQVVHVDTTTAHPPAVIARALNALLPRDVAVYGAWDVSSDFHARFGATWRRYRYLLDPAPVAAPMLRHMVVPVAPPPDSAAMQAALDMLIGEHDFAGFASQHHDSTSTVRHCFRARCEPIRWEGRTLLAIELVANAFLRHMVRTIVGTVLEVGHHRRTLAAFGAVLHTADRRQAGPTAAPHGLTLVAVGYPASLIPPAMHIAMDEDGE